MAAFGLFTGSEALHHRAVSQSLAFRELRAYLTAAAEGGGSGRIWPCGFRFAHVISGYAGYTSPARTTLGVAV